MKNYGPDHRWRVAHQNGVVTVALPGQKLTVRDAVTVERFTSGADAMARAEELGYETT